jgi:archaellum component FlaC
VAAALQNVAGQLRIAEQRLAAARGLVAQAFRIRSTPDRSAVGAMRVADAEFDRTLENGVLYLEQLLDKQRAEDLVRLAKDLAQRRREVADLLERFKASPSDAAKQELLARISRMKERVKELLARMAELSKGFNDEHMNREALAEMSKSRDLVAGLDGIEEKLAKGDLEGAMKDLDAMASAMDEMLAGLQRTAGLPDEKAEALMKEMLAFKGELEKVKAEQEQAAAETDKLRQAYRDAVQRRVKDAEEKVRRLERLAGEAKRDVETAQPGITYRAEPEFDQARESLEDVRRALGMKELGPALESAQRAAPAVERLAQFLEEDVALSQQNSAFTRREPGKVRDAQGNVQRAVPKVREIRDTLAELFPDPRKVMSPGDQAKMDGLSRRQSDLERKAGELQRKLSELAQKAPVFPPTAQGQLGETRGHMGQAASELGQKNPQRGHGEQQLALDALSRFQKGLEDAARKGKGQGAGAGFPFPFADAGGGEQEGDGHDPSRDKVNIPGAEAYRVPEEFRKDLLDAMKQGAPERYRSEVQRYYEELVK